MPDQDEQDVLSMLTIVIRSLVDLPGHVTIRPISSESGTTFRVQVSPSDLGKVIGVQGRTARALRILLSANSARLRRSLMLDLSGEPTSSKD